MHAAHASTHKTALFPSRLKTFFWYFKVGADAEYVTLIKVILAAIGDGR